MGICKKHEEEVDTWYDCAACVEEADKWAERKGYTHAVSPGKMRGDFGKWTQFLFDSSNVAYKWCVQQD